MPRGKTTREKFKTWGDVFDEFTSKVLFKLITQGYFEGLQSPVSIGKESNVFTAIRSDDTPVIVKIYRLETSDFNRMYEYIKADPRFPNIKPNRRKVIFEWSKREYRNLLKAREAGVIVPTPLANSHNVIVMEAVMSGTLVSSKLKDAVPKDLSSFFDLVIDNMKRLYNAGYTHGDLSAFNILNHNDRPVLIDFSAATTKENPHFQEYLLRDVKNICIYFNKIGLDVDKENVLKEITSGDS